MVYLLSGWILVYAAMCGNANKDEEASCFKTAGWSTFRLLVGRRNSGVYVTVILYNIRSGYQHRKGYLPLLPKRNL